MILMSATICAEKFSNYFSRLSIQNIDDEERVKETYNLFMNKPIKREEWGRSHDASEWALDEATRR